jgi:argonaute-like protein implicated in RNA metabolism and viral defense
MKVSEIMNNENRETRTRLLRFIDGQAYGGEIEQIKQHSVKEGKKPTVEDGGEREAPSR